MRPSSPSVRRSSSRAGFGDEEHVGALRRERGDLDLGLQLPEVVEQEVEDLLRQTVEGRRHETAR
jgi:hypothetical protein